jgi:hypothetical protein
MCYTKEASIGAFVTSILSCLALYIYGNPKYKKENLNIIILFVFVSFMQLFDYMMYIDPNCTQGWNKLAGVLGPLFNAFQPSLLYLLLIVNKSPYVGIASLINIPYILFILFIYSKYLSQGSLCSFQENGGLTWSWSKNGFGTLFGIIYLIVMLFNFIFYIQSPIYRWAMIIILLFYGISYLNYRYHLGRFWCFFVNTIPLFVLIVQKSLLN